VLAGGSPADGAHRVLQPVVKRGVPLVEHEHKRVGERLRGNYVPLELRDRIAETFELRVLQDPALAKAGFSAHVPDTISRVVREFSDCTPKGHNTRLLWHNINI